MEQLRPGLAQLKAEVKAEAEVEVASFFFALPQAEQEARCAAACADQAVRAGVLGAQQAAGPAGGHDGGRRRRGPERHSPELSCGPGCGFEEHQAERASRPSRWQYMYQLGSDTAAGTG